MPSTRSMLPLMCFVSMGAVAAPVRGELKEVLFYKADVEKNLERRYHPGE